jgi:Flp pilus assembly protein TadG
MKRGQRPPRINRIRKPSVRVKASTRFALHEVGAAAVEFTLVAPIYILMLVGITELSLAMYNRFALNGSVSAAANYAILNASEAGSTSGATLAQNLALIVANGHASNWANATITVNNGPVATLSGGVVTTSGTATNANSCYCPTLSGSAVTWGSAMTCGAVCSGGGIAGKFVWIVATSQYTSLFGSSGVMPSQMFTTSSVVETQ